jgi:hypothetical protein
MSKQLEVLVEDEHGEERTIIVEDYEIKEGYPAETSRAPEDCHPGEPDRIEDIEVKWEDTNESLTDEEFEVYQEQIEEAIFETNKGENDD